MKRTLTIGLHMTVGAEVTRRLVDGVLKYLADHEDLKIIDFCYEGDMPELIGCPPWTGRTDGVVLDIPRQPGILRWLRSGRLPVVNTCADLRKDLLSVFHDIRSIMRLAVEHFLQLGFQHFALIDYRYADGSSNRYQAVADELVKYNINSLWSYEMEHMPSGTYHDEASQEEPELVRLLDHAKKPLAVISANDRMAAAICRIAVLLGLKIPGDVAVLSIGDSGIARTTSPPITSFRLEFERVGFESVKLLHRVLLGEKPTRRAVLVPVRELVERESTVGKRRAPVTDVQRAQDFIRQMVSEAIRVRDVAAHVNVPLRTFELQFAEATGHTVGEEIRQLRLERAKTLLETTDLSLDRVAKLLGMNAGSYLYEFFRRWTGITPAQYREGKLISKREHK
jgi:DNA-binding LacI/PurR family transcriptional regulator